MCIVLVSYAGIIRRILVSPSPISLSSTHQCFLKNTFNLTHTNFCNGLSFLSGFLDGRLCLSHSHFSRFLAWNSDGGEIDTKGIMCAHFPVPSGVAMALCTDVWMDGWTEGEYKIRATRKGWEFFPLDSDMFSGFGNGNSILCICLYIAFRPIVPLF